MYNNYRVRSKTTGTKVAGLTAVSLLVLVSFLSFGPTVSALAADHAVYVQTNTAPDNFVIVFDRAANGQLTLSGRVATGGAGKPANNPPLGIPFLDSAGSVTLSDDGKFLFVVNAGDNTVSSFLVRPQGLQLADRKPTFGSRPISSTSYGNLLYVLNYDTTGANISGYRVDGQGRLTPIPGSVKPTAHPTNGIPAQVQFDSHGEYLAVSERQTFTGTGFIDIFPVGTNGVAGTPAAYPSADEGPFGITFTRENVMIVSNEHFELPPETSPSTVSSYQLSRDGSVGLIGTEPTNSAGACWNVITKDQKYVLITSPFTSNINSFRIGRCGDLMPVNGTSVVGTGSGATLDLALSQDSRFLYVLDSAGFAFSVIDIYTVNHDGTITPIGTTAPFEGTASGAAAR
jgi:6-phosphogluconolactonase (cycloisomerase 2 family)